MGRTQIASGALPASYAGITAQTLRLRVKHLGREACHLHPSSAEVETDVDTPPLPRMFSWHSAQEKVYLFLRYHRSVTVSDVCMAGILESL
jgi:hypothetical protein